MNCYFEGQNIINSIMDGTISDIIAHKGQFVKMGDLIFYLNSLVGKEYMDIPIVATIDGILESINVKVGQKVEANEVLAIINSSSDCF